MLNVLGTDEVPLEFAVPASLFRAHSAGAAAAAGKHFAAFTYKLDARYDRETMLAQQLSD